jgi:hypothetical protein
LRDAAFGRRSSELRKFAEDGSLMSEWNTDMRYSHGREVQDRHVVRWREDARDLVNRMEEG